MIAGNFLCFEKLEITAGHLCRSDILFRQGNSGARAQVHLLRQRIAMLVYDSPEQTLRPLQLGRRVY